MNTDQIKIFVMITKKMFSSVTIALSLIVSVSILSSCGPVIDKLIDKIVVEANKQCPISLDSETRLDSITHPEKGILKYSHTLINLTGEELEVDKDKIIPALKNIAIDNLKNTTISELKAILKLNAIFRYTYYDKNGELLFSFDVTPEEYK